MQATAPQIKTSYLVEVKFSNGQQAAYRWPTLRRAKACARDFYTAQVSIRPVRGFMTFEGWQAAQGGAA